MRKFICAVFAFLLLFSAAGCSSAKTDVQHCVFKGENESWAAVYAISVYPESPGRTRTIDQLSVTWRKDLFDLHQAKHLQICCFGSDGEENMTRNFDKNNPPQKTYVMQSSAENAAVETGNETIKVTVSLDGNNQTLELKKSG